MQAADPRLRIGAPSRSGHLQDARRRRRRTITRSGPGGSRRSWSRWSLPSSRHRDYEEKPEEYLRLGVGEYWIVDADRGLDEGAATVARPMGRGRGSPSRRLQDAAAARARVLDRQGLRGCCRFLSSSRTRGAESWTRGKRVPEKLAETPRHDDWRGLAAGCSSRASRCGLTLLIVAVVVLPGWIPVLPRWFRRAMTEVPAAGRLARVLCRCPSRDSSAGRFGVAHDPVLAAEESPPGRRAALPALPLVPVLVDGARARRGGRPRLDAPVPRPAHDVPPVRSRGIPDPRAGRVERPGRALPALALGGPDRGLEAPGGHARRAGSSSRSWRSSATRWSSSTRSSARSRAGPTR